MIRTSPGARNWHCSRYFNSSFVQCRKTIIKQDRNVWCRFWIENLFTYILRALALFVCLFVYSARQCCQLSYVLVIKGDETFLGSTFVVFKSIWQWSFQLPKPASFQTLFICFYKLKKKNFLIEIQLIQLTDFCFL